MKRKPCMPSLPICRQRTLIPLPPWTQGIQATFSPRRSVSVRVAPPSSCPTCSHWALHPQMSPTRCPMLFPWPAPLTTTLCPPSKDLSRILGQCLPQRQPMPANITSLCSVSVSLATHMNRVLTHSFSQPLGRVRSLSCCRRFGSRRRRRRWSRPGVPLDVRS